MFSRLTTLPRQALLLVLANAVTMLGSGLTVFGLDVWIFRQTGSYELFAALAIASALPALLFSPLAGVIVDRYPRRTVLLAVELMAAAVVGALLVCHLQGVLGPIPIGLASILLGLGSSLSWPASAAAVTALTDNDDQRARLNGLGETLGGAAMILCPLLGGILMALWGIDVVLTADLVSYLLCAVLIALLRFPASAATQADEDDGAAGATAAPGFWTEVTFGFRWIAGQRHLLVLLGFFAFTNIGTAIVSVALAPYLMSFNADGVLGLCLSVLGAGTIVGGMVFTLSGGLKRHEHGVLLGTLLSAGAMIALGLTRSTWGLALCAFMLGLCGPLINASSHTIWQSEVPGAAQGRVFAVRRMIAWGLQPLSILLSIPLLGALFEPLLGGAGPRAQWFGWLWGTGQSGAIGMMISVCGTLSFVLALFILASGSLTRRTAAASSSELPVETAAPQ